MRASERPAPATMSSSPASPPAARAGSAARAGTASASAVAAGSSATCIDGTQAEYVRVPFADTSTYPVPAGVSDEEVLMLADIGPTGYEVGVLNGAVRPGDVVVVVGAGPIGLSAIMGARLFSPAHIVAVDLADSRLEAAKRFGADTVVHAGREDALARRARPHRRPRRRRRDRGGRRPGDVRAVQRRWCGPAGAWPTWASTVSRPPCTWRTCGSRTSRSPRDWSTPSRRRPCSSSSRAARWTSRRFVTHRFPMGEFIAGVRRVRARR